MARTNRNTNGHSRRAVVRNIEGQTQTINIAPVTDQPVQDGMLLVTCPKCGWQGEISAALSSWSLQCPDCKTWILVRLHPDLSHYVRGLGVTPSGNDTLDIADTTADMLRGQDLDALYSTVSENLLSLGIESMGRTFVKAYGKDSPWTKSDIESFLIGRYQDRNPGMQRMNLGNLLRAALKNAC